MNSYEAKQAARAERKRERAAKFAAESAQLATKNDALLGCMNGTPILVGHHSERRHRRDLDRIHNDTRKSIELHKAAEQLAGQADKIERNLETDERISSDDPEALTKLRARLDGLTGPEARRIRDRIAELEKKAAHVDRKIELPGVTVEECAAENRTRISFDARQPESVTRQLKSHGFRWAPTLGVWQRHMTSDAWYWAEQIAKSVGGAQ